MQETTDAQLIMELATLPMEMSGLLSNVSVSIYMCAPSVYRVISSLMLISVVDVLEALI